MNEHLPSEEEFARGLEDIFVGLEELLQHHDEMGQRRATVITGLQVRYPDLDVLAYAHVLRASITHDDDPDVTDDEAREFLCQHIDQITASLAVGSSDEIAKTKIDYAGRHFAHYGDEAQYLNAILDIVSPAGAAVSDMSQEEVYHAYREMCGQDVRRTVVYEALQIQLNHDYLPEVVQILNELQGKHEQRREQALCVIAMATQLAIAKWELRHLNEIPKEIRRTQEQSVRVVIMNQLAEMLPGGRGNATVTKKLFRITSDAEEALEACPELLATTLEYDLAVMQVRAEDAAMRVIEYDAPSYLDADHYDRLMKPIAQLLLRNYMQILADRFGAHKSYREPALMLIQTGIESALINVESARKVAMTSEELEAHWRCCADVPNQILTAMGMRTEYKRGEYLLFLTSLIRRAHDEAVAYLYD